jgi:heme a synthase
MRSNSRADRFFRTALMAVLFGFVSVVFSAYLRQSEAGIGCPDGPACEAKAVAPMAAMDMIGPSSPNKRAWKDMVIRYISGILGIFLMRMAVLGWQFRHRPDQQVVMPLITLVMVFAFTAVGVLTIDLNEKPLVMTIQYMGSLFVLALLWWIVLREQRLFRSVAASAQARQLRWRALASLLFGALAILTGVWSTVNYAGLACPDFPTCQGVYVPEMDAYNGLWRWYVDGLDYDRAELDLPGAAAIQVAHRVGALMALLYLGWFGLRLMRIGFQAGLFRYGLLLIVMLSFAVIFGVMDAVTGMPITISVTHSATGALLLMTLVTIYHVLRPPKPRT